MEKKRIVLSIIFSFFVFLTLNLPSVKLFYSSSLLNIVACAGIWFVGFIRQGILKDQRVTLKEYQMKYFLYFGLLWGGLFYVTLLHLPPVIGIIDTFQYISVAIFTIGILVFLRKEDLNYLFIFQMLWGCLISFLEYTRGIPKDRSLGQHYLTSGVAIVVTIVMVFGYIYSSNSKSVIKISLIPVLVLLYAGVTSLRGRAPIMLSLLIPLIIIFISVLTERDLRKKIIFLTLIIGITGVSLVILYNVLPDYTIDRILRMFVSIEEEPRYNVYRNTIQLILENPFGIGLGGYKEYMGYPHNIFLEIVLSGGFIMILPIIFLGYIILRTAIKVIKEKSATLIWLSILLYIFFTWNISFELSGTYMLFSVIVIYFKSYNENHKQVERENILNIS